MAQLRSGGATGAPPLTPEEEAYFAELAASQQAAPAPAAEPLVPAGTPAPPTQTLAYPTAGVQNNPAGSPEAVAGYGEQIPSSQPAPAPAPQPDYGASPRPKDPYAQERQTAQMPPTPAFPPPTSVESFPDRRRYTRADYSGVGQPAIMSPANTLYNNPLATTPRAGTANADPARPRGGGSLAAMFGQAQDRAVAMKATPPKPPRVTKAMMEEAGRAIYQRALGYDPRLGPNQPPLLGIGQNLPGAFPGVAGMPMETAGRYGGSPDAFALAPSSGSPQQPGSPGGIGSPTLDFLNPIRQGAQAAADRVVLPAMQETARATLGSAPTPGIPNYRVEPRVETGSSYQGIPNYREPLSLDPVSDANALSSLLEGVGSQNDMSPPGFDLGRAGLPTLDWATPMMEAAQRENPEVAASNSARAGNRALFPDQPGWISGVQEWFTERTSPAGRKQNLETLQGNLPESLPRPNTISLASDYAGIPNFDRSPTANRGAGDRPIPWNNASLSGVLQRAAARAAEQRRTGTMPQEAAPARSATPDPAAASRLGLGSTINNLIATGVADETGKFTDMFMRGAQGDGTIDANGAWTARAAELGFIDGKWVGMPAAVTDIVPPARFRGGSAPAEDASSAGQPLDPNATIPVTPAAVAAPATDASSGGGSGRQWVAYGGGGGRSYGGGGYSRGGGYSSGGGYSRGGRSGGFDSDDDDFADLDWESLLRDFDNDGDIDDADEVKAKSKAARRRGRRKTAAGGNPRVAGAPDYQTTPERERILGVIAKSKSGGGTAKRKGGK